jgi:predicted nuclease with RNAse H fold
MDRWLGVDVGGKRKRFDIALIDDRRVLALEGHLSREEVIQLVETERPTIMAIDSPRCCAPIGQTTRAGERQLAKAVCGIRWTPDESRVHASAYYAWIVEGLLLFDALAQHDVEVIEVFPTASWTRWHGARGTRTRSDWSKQGLAELALGGVPTRTNQDQRDAIAAAVTARQHTHGMTEALGEIVVPVSRREQLGLRQRHELVQEGPDVLADGV